MQLFLVWVMEYKYKHFKVDISQHVKDTKQKLGKR